MSLNPQDTALSSLLGGFGSTAITGWSTMVVTGSIADLGTLNFTTTITPDQSNPNYMWDIIGYNPTADPFINVYSLVNTTVKFGSDTFLYKESSGETATFTNNWNPGTKTITIQASIFNGSGGPITLVNQTIFFAGIYFPAPF